MAVVLRVLRWCVVVTAVGIAAAATAVLADVLHAPRRHGKTSAPLHQVARPAESASLAAAPAAVAYLVVEVLVQARASSSGGTFADVAVAPEARLRPDCPPAALASGRSATWLRADTDAAALARAIEVCIPVQGGYQVSRVRRTAGQLQRDSLVRESPLAEEASYIRAASLVVSSDAGRFELGAVAGGVVACETVECVAPVYSAAALVGTTRGRFGAGVLRVRVPEGETAVGIEALDDGS